MNYEELTQQPIEFLNLSARTRNCLKKAGVEKIADLIIEPEEDLAKVRFLSKNGCKQILQRLAENGLSMKQKQAKYAW